MTPEAIALLCLGCFSAGLWAATFVLQRRHAARVKPLSEMTYAEMCQIYPRE